MAGHDLSPFALFSSDIARSLRIWQRDPRLPLTALTLAILEFVPFSIAWTTGEEWLNVFSVAIATAFLGFYGTTRVWYVAVDRDRSFSWADARGLTKQLWWRYVRLGTLLIAVWFVPYTVILVATDEHSFVRAALLGIAALPLDMAFTFATVGLAFNEGTARDALRHSLRVIRTQWPTCAWYVLLPPMAFQLICRVLPRHSLGLAALLALQLAAVILALACKGATVLFYADRYPTLAESVITDPQPRGGNGLP